MLQPLVRASIGMYLIHKVRKSAVEIVKYFAV